MLPNFWHLFINPILKILKFPFWVCWFFVHPHYSRFEVHLFIIRQNMNFGFWNFFLVQIVADYVYFHMTYHTFIWNHASWHRIASNMTYFQLFAWFGQTLLVRKMGGKSKLLIVDTFGSKTNFQLSCWYWTICSYQIFKCN